MSLPYLPSCPISKYYYLSAYYLILFLPQCTVRVDVLVDIFQLVLLFLVDISRLLRTRGCSDCTITPTAYCLPFSNEYHHDHLTAVSPHPLPPFSFSDREVQRTMLELLNQLDGFSSDTKIKVRYHITTKLPQCISNHYYHSSY